MAWVYILDGIRSHKVCHYIGCTTDLQRRLIQHLNGESRFTSTMSDIRLRFSFQCHQYHMKSLENYLKKHHNAVYAILKRELDKVAVINLKVWLQDHQITVEWEWHTSV